MAMNTPYLGSSASVPSNLNTSYISTGLTEITSAVSFWGPVTFLNSAVTLSGSGNFSTLVVTSTETVGGATTLSATSIRGLADFNSTRTQSGTLSYHTTASATSLILPDGAFGVYFESVTSARLCFRSGFTTYTWIATTGAVL